MYFKFKFRSGWDFLMWKKNCGNKGPNLYIGPWALFDDVDTSEGE